MKIHCRLLSFFHLRNGAYFTIYKHLCRTAICQKSPFKRRLTNSSSILEVLNDQKCQSSPVTLTGWVRNVRQHKKTAFVTLADGTSVDNLQVIIPPDLVNGITHGSCVTVKGNIVRSPYPEQEFEMKATDIDVVARCDQTTYPLSAKLNESVSEARHLPHLRSKIDIFNNILRLRSKATFTIHQYFQDLGYILVQTPVITTNDCEGAGETFNILTEEECVHNNGEGERKKFFSKDAYLTVSSQLHLEAAASGFMQVYSIGPVFRAEKAPSRLHLAEFCMVEAEINFLSSLDLLIKVIEDLVRGVTRSLIESSHRDLDYFWKLSPNNREQLVMKLLDGEFVQLTYHEALKILQQHENQFEYKPQFGSNLKKEHENYLSQYCGHAPLFVTDFPVDCKPFYTKLNPCQTTVSCCDLLLPDIGELVGGSVREDNYDALSQRMQSFSQDQKENLQWYLDLRRFGCPKHGGYGLGFDRYLKFLLDIKRIHDLTPFPRFYNHCKL